LTATMILKLMILLKVTIWLKLKPNYNELFD
jgi:hypothetical protein